MTDVQFNCPQCEGLFQVDEGLAGQQVECPLCRQVIQLPELDSETDAAIPAPPPPPDSSAEPPIENVPGETPAAPPQPPLPSSPFEPPISASSDPPHAPEPALDSPAAVSPPLMLICPLCDGPFQVDSGPEVQHVECPHCLQTIAVSDEEPGPDPPAIDPPISPPESNQEDGSKSEEGDLPPSALGIDGIVPGKEIATAKESAEVVDRTIEIALEDGPVQLHEQDGKDQIVGRRRLKRAAKGRQKLQKNLILWTVSALVLVGVLVALMLKG